MAQFQYCKRLCSEIISGIMARSMIILKSVDEVLLKYKFFNIFVHTLLKVGTFFRFIRKLELFLTINHCRSADIFAESVIIKNVQF